jgi:prepilin-type N-terminal cleavage/methylation domain-containing protein
MRWHRSRSDRGETLVEVLVALVIMSIAAVAILTGIGLSVKAADINRKEATGGAYVRSWAEAIQRHVGAGNYVACAGSGAYAPGAVGFTVPSGYTATASTAKSVSATGVATACSTDSGAQLVTLSLATPDARANETLAIILRKPCTGNSCTS